MKIHQVGILLLVQIILACTKPEAVDLTTIPIIPKPLHVTASENTFILSNKTRIQPPDNDTRLTNLTTTFRSQLKDFLNINIADKNESYETVILLGINAKSFQGESHRISIKRDSIMIEAGEPAGLFRALQSVLQIALLQKHKKQIMIPTGVIEDRPAYHFRSSMLDVSRHFFGVEDVKRFIDLIALYKFNFLHLHLSDDQGWRIEIKSWPNLTKHGGSIEVGGGKSSFYTQKEYSEIVQYAASRFITVIPEVDFPGHTNAALASYPELNCDGKAPDLYTGTKVGFSSLCINKPITYKFVDDVVRELAEITPGPYIHLGGDESLATPKKEYIKFFNRAQQIVSSHNKIMIGWEEIAQADIVEGTIVQYWSKAKHAIEGVKKGAKIIMSPATKVYLDMKYDSTTQLGQDWAAQIEIDSAYLWTLSGKVKGITKDDILGVEAALWTETISTMDEIEYMVFPRLPAIAEVGWSQEETRSWTEFQRRLGHHARIFKSLDIDYYPSNKVEWIELGN